MTIKAYVIRHYYTEYQQQPEEKYQTKMTDNDDVFYHGGSYGNFTCSSKTSTSYVLRFTQMNRREKRRT